MTQSAPPPGPVDRQRLMIPALGPVYAVGSRVSYPLIRFVAGAALIPHGWSKLLGGRFDGTVDLFRNLGIEPAALLVTYIGLLELVGGAMLAIGLLTRLVALQVFVFMAVAVVHVHWSFGYFWNRAGWEMPMLWGVLALAILLRGGGPLSIDALMTKEI